MPTTNGEDVALVSSGKVAVHRLKTGELIAEWKIPAIALDNVHAFHQQPIVCLSEKGKLRFWNYVEKRETPEWTIDNNLILQFAISPNDRWMAISNQQGQMTLFDIAERRKMGTTKSLASFELQ